MTLDAARGQVKECIDMLEEMDEHEVHVPRPPAHAGLPPTAPLSALLLRPAPTRRAFQMHYAPEGGSS